MDLWRAFGLFLEGWATSQSGEPAQGLEDMRRGVERNRYGCPTSLVAFG